MDRYIVTNDAGVSIRKVTSTVNNAPVGKLDKGAEFPVYQTYQSTLFGLIYTWGRISAEPDDNGQHRYVALSRSGGKVFCEKVFSAPEEPAQGGNFAQWAREIDAWARKNGFDGVGPE